MSSKYSQSYQKDRAYQFSNYYPESKIQTHHKSQETSIQQINSFQIDIQSIAPLLARLNDENNELQYQKQFIAQQMILINHSTVEMSKQNQQLMVHYKKRSQDIKHLIQTILVNTNQSHNDLSQSVETYYDNNSKIAKQIERLIKQNKNSAQQSRKLNESIVMSVQKKHELECLLSKLKIRNEKKMCGSEFLILKKQKQKVQQLQNEINELLLQIRSKSAHNFKMLTIFKQKVKDEEELNPQNISYSLDKNMENIRYLQQEKQKLISAKQKIQNSQQRLRKLHKNLIDKKISGELEWNKKIYKLDHINEHKHQVLRLLPQHKIRILSLRQQLQNKKYEANKIRMKICNKELIIKKKREQHLRKSEKKLNKYEQQIIKTKLLINKQVSNQLYKIGLQMQSINKTIEKYQQQFSHLQWEGQHYSDEIKKQNNPIGELLAFEHSLFKNKI